MSEQWRAVEGFPPYEVSNYGRVKNGETGQHLTLTQNQRGLIKVALMTEEGQVNRSVALMVANAWLGPHKSPHFNTPIHLDGDKTNNNVENLEWRPRWFAIRFQQQFKHDYRVFMRVPIVDVETGEPFRNGMDAARKYGLLDKDIMLSVANNTIVFPTGQRFHTIE